MNRKSLPMILGALIVIAVLCMLPKYTYNDPDTFWHIELGQYMLQHGTVLHHAIHTYSGNNLPYVPHEFGFQLIIALLYSALGWPGIYLLTAACLFMLIWGLYRLCQVSRKEMGLGEPPAFLIVLILVITVCVYYYYFASRPQIISSGMIVWFFVFLREYRLQNKLKYAILLILFSLALANIHAGVWPVIAVFTGMAFIEDVTDKNMKRNRLLVFVAVYAVGLLNVGGWRSILYVLTVTQHHFNLLIDEWNAIQFTSLENLPRLLALMFFATILPYSLHKKMFRFLVMLGVLYLGVSSYKQNLFMWLFIPYFAATAIEAAPWLESIKLRFNLRHLLACVAIGLLLQSSINFIFPTQVSSKLYPVEEMSYILDRGPDGIRPKVMAPYGSSGYITYRGGDVLADGRQDPYITDASRGAYGWTAFERSMYGFSERLPEIVRSDRPDYVIARSNVSELLYADWVTRYGEPLFKGPFGSVFLISRQ
ncbi:hypothetical protein D7Z26_01080 [Cohnella endophytica]|uniref:Glycosyltransferase RgtA/B/C/D-like domain-containing protein n=1 Tax=Cohnella endophytica TaxID=2419778 RepID=A0A494Y627_9BACL|nr:hypothetical protein [Cohnella endophytica]RKP58127.1 hypothetical protein D7Z26_01080 [Cohnella endophytica]